MNEHKKEGSDHSRDDLPERFDSWIKHTLKFLLKTEIRSLVRGKKRAEAEIPVESPEEYLEDQLFDPYSVLDDEVILLGDTSLRQVLPGLSLFLLSDL